MEPAAVQQKLGDALQRMLKLPQVLPVRIAEEEADIFANFRDAIRAARKDEALFDGFTLQDMLMACSFVQRRGTQKRLYSKQAQECLKLLLLNAGWHRAAHADEVLYASLKAFLAGDPEAVARLNEVPANPIEVCANRQTPTVRGRAASAEECESIKRLLLEGVSIMEQFDYHFPGERNSVDFDIATDGHRKVYDAINRLSVASKAVAEENPENAASEKALAAEILHGLEIRWGDVLRFLCSMHTCGTRRAHRGRIEYVASKLEVLAPEFRDALQTQSGKLPWSSIAAGGLAANGPAALASPEAADAAAVKAEPHTSAALASREAADAAAVKAASHTSTAGASPPQAAATAASAEPHAPAAVVSPQAAAAAVSSAPHVWSTESSGELPSREAGRFFLCNSTDEDLLFQIEQTGQTYRLQAGSDMVFDAEAETVKVRIDRSRMLFWRTRLGVVDMSQMKCYNVMSNGAGGITVQTKAE